MTPEKRKKKIEDFRSVIFTDKENRKLNPGVFIADVAWSQDAIEFLISEIESRDEALRLAHEILLDEYGPAGCRLLGET